ncbi:uncharacterized oxidoreductase C24B10.20-like [Actinia tenebrosa]|uniref:Uncharacterized oxidoreductase C24B10.20-like n=1 Tax=Actinia tenebrosa TaxID=6105 RepID=A0A6P8IIV3_ACTTE|nr:uncharacterized oxidoreductase C24B10.20-like [Actinia tenebrosa]
MKILTKQIVLMTHSNSTVINFLSYPPLPPNSLPSPHLLSSPHSSHFFVTGQYYITVLFFFVVVVFSCPKYENMMASSPVALVQGASRGIGLQFCRQLLARNSTGLVIATCRDPSSASELQDLGNKYPTRLGIYALDVKNEDQISEVKKEILSNQVKKIDLLVNCAGILHPSGKGETSLREVTQTDVSSTFLTNTVGPLLMAKHFGPLLLKGDSLFGSQPGQFCGILANISARVGSITDNKLGGWYSYRLSKSALNMATKTLSIELGRGRKKVVCISVHPGTVDTELSRRYHKNIDPAKIFTPEFSVQSMMGIIDGLSIEDTGKFFAWDGQEISY